MAVADLAKRKKFIPKCPQMEMPIKHKMSFKKKSLGKIHKLESSENMNSKERTWWRERVIRHVLV